jgi:hypothetical protein
MKKQKVFIPLIDRIIHYLQNTPKGATQEELVDRFNLTYQNNKKSHCSIVRSCIRILRQEGFLIIDTPELSQETGGYVKRYRLAKNNEEFYKWAVDNAYQNGFKVKRGRPVHMQVNVTKRVKPTRKYAY